MNANTKNAIINILVFGSLIVALTSGYKLL